ncbi:MAG TPA: hypothetical protein VNJ01_13760 [Bacteriovoracaceae bacterium]|nr:hypothetical protein [Bacteriovoracaceae bacterium]
MSEAVIEFSIYAGTDKAFVVSTDIYEKEDGPKVLVFNCLDNSLFEIYGPAVDSWKLLGKGQTFNQIAVNLSFQYNVPVEIISQEMRTFFTKLLKLKIISEK